MLRESVPSIVLVSSPQNSKDKNLINVDLLQDPIFRRVVDRFDRALGVGSAGSLAEDRQMASVVMSVATHETFAHRLRKKIPDSQYNVRFIGHSVGEMGSFIGAGVTDIETAAWVLDRRQEITEKPLESTLRLMVACVGIDMKRLETEFGRITETYGDRVKAVLANRNTPWKGVLSLEIPLGEEPRAVTKKLGEIFRELKPPGIERNPAFVHLNAIKNAFHSYLLMEEELVLQGTIDPVINERNFRHPEPGLIYSPMLPGWISTREQALYVLRNQLTSGVHFSQGIQDMLKVPGLRLFVTSDVKENVSPDMVRENIDGRVPVININNEASMSSAVDQTAEMLQKIA